MNYKMFSIIIPVYNAQLYVEKLIQQIRKTMYYAATEVIFIDDGSTDKSYSILKQSVNPQTAEILIHQENKGVSAARNLGLSNASGKYIMFFDADDEIDVAAYDRMTKKVVKEEADIAVFGIRDIFHTKKGKTRVYDNYAEEKVYTAHEFFQGFGNFLNKQILYSPCNKVYKRELIEKTQIRFDERYAIGEDMLFNLDCFKEANVIAMISEYVYLYQHYAGENSGSMHYHENFYESLSLIMEKMISLLTCNDAYEENITQLHIFLLGKISYAINNLYFRDAPLNDEDRKAFILSLYYDDLVVEALQDKHAKMEGFDQKIMKLLHSKKQVETVMHLYKLRNSIR